MIRVRIMFAVFPRYMIKLEVNEPDTVQAHHRLKQITMRVDHIMSVRVPGNFLLSEDCALVISLKPRVKPSLNSQEGRILQNSNAKPLM
jgi:hypothetical protein